MVPSLDIDNQTDASSLERASDAKSSAKGFCQGNTVRSIEAGHIIQRLHSCKFVVQVTSCLLPTVVSERLIEN